MEPEKLFIHFNDISFVGVINYKKNKDLLNSRLKMASFSKKSLYLENCLSYNYSDLEPWKTLVLSSCEIYDSAGDGFEIIQ